MFTFLFILSSFSNFFYLCLSCFSFLKLHKLKIPPGWLIDVKVTSKNTAVIGFGIESWTNCAWSRARYQYRAQISNQNYIFIDFYSAQMPHRKKVLGLIPSFMWWLDLLFGSLWTFFFFHFCSVSSHSFRSRTRFDWMWPPDQGITASLPVTVGKSSSSSSDPSWLTDWLDDWIDRWVVKNYLGNMQQMGFQYWNNFLELVPKWSKYDVTNMNYYERYDNKKRLLPVITRRRELD